MFKKNKYIFINFVTALAVTLFFSCQSKTSGVSLNTEESPMGEVYDLNLKYTDSGRLTAILRTPKMLDYSHLPFPYREFPDGIILNMIDEEGKISVVTSDYAVSYESTGLIDMIGNVDIKTADSTHLIADQLYWNTQVNWVFTDQPYKSILPDGNINEADGFDANQDFSILNSRMNDGIMVIED